MRAWGIDGERHDQEDGRPVRSRNACSITSPMVRPTSGDERVARAGRQLPLAGAAALAEIERCCGASPTPFCPSAALPEAGSYVAREAAGTPIVAVRGSRRQGARPSATPAGIAACRWPSGAGCAAPSSAAITAGPTISKAGCATSRTRTAFPGFDKEAPSRWCRSPAERALRPGVRHPGPAGAGRRFARRADRADRAGSAAVRHRSSASSRSTGRSSSRASSRATTSSRRIPRASCPTASTT